MTGEYEAQRRRSVSSFCGPIPAAMEREGGEKTLEEHKGWIP